MNGNYSAGIYGSYYIKIPKTKIRVFGNPSANIARTTNFVNGLKNVTQSNNISARVGAYTFKDKVYEVSVSAAPSYNQSKPSISSVAATHYWSYRYSLDGNYTLPGKFEIGSDIVFNFRQKLNTFDNNNDVILWNAYIEKKFMKNDALTLRASVNDILDQNKGYSRNIQPFSIEEKHYLTFQRYGLLTLTWNFNNKGGTPPK